MGILKSNLQGIGFGAVNAYALMIFTLLYVPCIASLATIYRETKSKKWLCFEIAMQLIVAWIITMLVFQIIKLFI